MTYQPLPTTDGEASYPPILASRDDIGPPYPLKSSHRNRWRSMIKWILGPVFALAILHYVLLGAFPGSTYAAHFRTYNDEPVREDYMAATAAASAMLEQLDPAAGQPGTFFRDAHPIRSMLAFWELAEKEVKARGLDTCQGQLSKELVEAYHRSQMAYCLPHDASEDIHLTSMGNGSLAELRGGTSIWCMPVREDGFSKWWPYPAAPCLSVNIRPVQDSERKFRSQGCQLTTHGERLKEEMDRERFLGSDLDGVDEEITSCKEVLDRTIIVIGRQDQWNPFHVAEDLITTLVTVFIVARGAPDLVDSRVQLVFSEGFGMDANHFTPLWDRVGAWAPRRLALDPWGEGICLTNTIHSVGAGASLLSAMGVGNPYSCASTITWAASHYYRHLFGLLPPSLSSSAPQARKPINVLWLSRAKLDTYAQKHNDWSNWRDVRHIENEKELVARLRAGLRSLCETSGEISGGCVFEDAQEEPESWAITSPALFEDGSVPLRFAHLDPTVHALETQIHYVGHSDVLVSSHGGALGLSLFLPAGQATIVELQVESVRGNWHFQHMAMEMGHQYEMVAIEKQVNVEAVWESVQRWVLRAATQ